MSQGEPAAFRVVIPARFGATRLPGKPLLEIAGRTMIEHVHAVAQRAGAAEVLIAADDARIAEVAAAFGADVVMTSPEHQSGTDRLAEVAATRGWPERDIVVNLQGDEPCMPPDLVSAVAAALAQREGTGIATLATPIAEVGDLFDPNVVKVVLERNGHARYFSRAPIPWVRGLFCSGARPDELPPEATFLRHLGLYAYRVGTLRAVSEHPQVEAERAESLEQLRALAMGVSIHVSVTDQAPMHGVDTPDDLARVEQHMTGVSSDPTSGGPT